MAKMELGVGNALPGAGTEAEHGLAGTLPRLACSSGVSARRLAAVGAWYRGSPGAAVAAHDQQ